jgi:4-hydroxybenzoate polyprenyltransferase
VPYDCLSLKTLPQQIGIRNTKLLGIGLLLLCLVFEFFKYGSKGAYILSLLVFCLILGGLLAISKKYQSRYFASFWVEGLPIVWFLLFVVFEQL